MAGFTVDSSTEMVWTNLSALMTTQSTLSTPTLLTPFDNDSSLSGTTRVIDSRWDLPHNDTDPTDQATDVFKWHGAEITFLLIMFVLALLGNTFVIYVYHFRWRRSNFSFFIEALAGLDLTNASVTIPLFLVFTFNDQTPYFDSLCQSASFFAIATAVASGIVLVIIAYDRNRKICKPLEREISLYLTQKLCGLAIIIGLVLATLSVFINGRVELEFEDDGIKVNVTQCYFTEESKGSVLFWTFLVVVGLVFTAVVIILVVLYKSMYSALKVHLARRESLGSNRSRSMSTCSIKTIKPKTFRSQKASAKIFFTVTVAFFSCYFPFFVAVLVFLVGGQQYSFTPVVKSLVDIGKLAPFMSNAINPLIYSVSSKQFRREILGLFKCRKLKRQDSSRRGSKNNVQAPTTSSLIE